MSESGEGLPNKGGFFDFARNLFRKKERQVPQPQKLEATPELPPYDLEAIKRNIDAAEKLLKEGKLRDSSGEFKLPMSSDGKVEFLAWSELMGSQESLDLSEVKPGDIVWWRIPLRGLAIIALLNRTQTKGTLVFFQVEV